MKLIPAPHHLGLCEATLDLSGFDPQQLRFTNGEGIPVRTEEVDDPRADYHEISLAEHELLFRWNGENARSYLIQRLREIIALTGAEQVPTLFLQDYADVAVRGSIEGFYGIPWTRRDRLSVIRFSGRNRMNLYIYAPKDDAYHNQRWRELYDENGAREMSTLAEESRAEGVRFVWAIHPGMAKFRFDDYEAELQCLLRKYEQLYELGVRSFQLCMDDIDRQEALREQDRHMRLIRDIAAWIEEKQDVSRLLFVPPWYCGDWCREDGEEYMRALAQEDVEIMWTGRNVVVPVDPESYRYFRELTGQNPAIWFNYPVNDYITDTLLMNEFRAYPERGAKGTFDFFAANPMNQAEASLISLSQISDYLWNMEAFDPAASFEKALGLLEENADGLRAFSRYTGAIDPRSFAELGEDLEQYPELERALERQKQERPEELKERLEADLQALRSYRDTHSNERLFAEIEPWTRALIYKLEAALLLLQADEVTAPTLKGDVRVKVGAGKLDRLLQDLSGERGRS